MINLQKIKEDTNANIVILADKKGNIIDSVNTEYGKNLALMKESAFTMCNDLLKDLSGSNLDQLIGKSSENYFIINKIESDNLILIASDQMSKFGLLLKHMNSINKNKY